MATNVVREINSVRAFFKAREQLSAGDGDDDLRKCFTDAIIKQLNMVSVFSTQDAGHATECLKDSPYGCHTHRVISAIEAKLKSNQSVGSGAASSTANQFLKCWWAVLTQGDWDFIRDKRKSWDAKMTKVVERANLLGVTHPSEQSLKWLLALLLVVCYDELPSYATIFKKLGDLKHCVEAERKGYPLEQLVTYPATPQELSDEIFKYAYSDEQPIFVHLSGINVVAEHNIPLRKNSKLLTGSKSPPPDVSVSFSSLKREVAGEDKPTLMLEHREGSLPSVKATLKACKVDDSDEEALLLEYQAKLIKLKKGKRQAASAHRTRGLSLPRRPSSPHALASFSGSLCTLATAVRSYCLIIMMLRLWLATLLASRQSPWPIRLQPRTMTTGPTTMATCVASTPTHKQQ